MLPVSPLLTVFGFLPGRAAAVCACNIFFLLGLCLHLSLVGVFAFAAPAEVDTVLQNQVEVVHVARLSGGTDARL